MYLASVILHTSHQYSQFIEPAQEYNYMNLRSTVVNMISLYIRRLKCKTEQFLPDPFL